MPSRDSPGSVDPDDIEVAEVDTLFIQQGRAGAALGTAGCTGKGLLSSAVLVGAELGAQDGWGERQQVSGSVPLEARGALHPRTDARSSGAERSRAEEACSLPSARSTEEKGSLFLPSARRPRLYPTPYQPRGDCAVQRKPPPGKGPTSPSQATSPDTRGKAAS